MCCDLVVFKRKQSENNFVKHSKKQLKDKKLSVERDFQVQQPVRLILKVRGHLKKRDTPHKKQINATCANLTSRRTAWNNLNLNNLTRLAQQPRTTFKSETTHTTKCKLEYNPKHQKTTRATSLNPILKQLFVNKINPTEQLKHLEEDLKQSENILRDTSRKQRKFFCARKC